VSHRHTNYYKLNSNHINTNILFKPLTYIGIPSSSLSLLPLITKLMYPNQIHQLLLTHYCFFYFAMDEVFFYKCHRNILRFQILQWLISEILPNWLFLRFRVGLYEHNKHIQGINNNLNGVLVPNVTFFNFFFFDLLSDFWIIYYNAVYSFMTLQ